LKQAKKRQSKFWLKKDSDEDEDAEKAGEKKPKRKIKKVSKKRNREQAELQQLQDVEKEYRDIQQKNPKFQTPLTLNKLDLNTNISLQEQLHNSKNKLSLLLDKIETDTAKKDNANMQGNL